MAKVLQYGIYWFLIFKDAHEHYRKCNKCQRNGEITKRNELPLQYMLKVEIFYC